MAKAPETKTTPKAPAAKAPEQNGVTRPKDGTGTGRVWAICDKLSAKGVTASRNAVIDACKAEGINEATAATQYGRWRKFNGIKGTVAAPKASKSAAAAKPAAPAAKKPAAPAAKGGKPVPPPPPKK